MELGLTDQVVVVTGAASGIGLALVRAFLDESARVVGTDLHVEPLVDAGVPAADAIACDLRAEGAVEDVVARALAHHGRVDVLVNNVGVAPFRDGFLDASLADWRSTLDLNLFVAVRACRAVLPSMTAARRGSLVHLASDAGRQPDPFFVDYAVSKAALLSLSKSLSIEFGPHGIRSNCIAPGPTRTPAMTEFLEHLAADRGIAVADAPSYFGREMRQLPLGRMNEPDDVARVALFLASSASGQVTGSTYSVDAGSLRHV